MTDSVDASDASDSSEGELHVVQRYVEALAVFGNQVRDVQDHEWDLPTPCADWTVKDIVAHVVLGEAQLTRVLTGDTTQTQMEFTADLLGSTPLTTWRGTALKAIESARIDGLAEQVFDLDMGHASGEQLLSYRITDNLVHAWDVSVGVGRVEPIDEAQAQWLLDFWQPAAADMANTNFFGPPVEPPEGASASTRLLALLGRVAPV